MPSVSLMDCFYATMGDHSHLRKPDPQPDLATRASFGLEDIARLLRENRRLQAEADRLEAENKQLRAENNDMKSTLELVEQYFAVRKALHG